MSPVVEEKIEDTFKINKDNLRFRYIYNKLGNSKDPVATIATVMDRENGQMLLGMSRCCPEDMFKKKIGRHIAQERLKKFEDYTFVENDGERQIIANLFRLMKGNPIVVPLDYWDKFMDKCYEVLSSEKEINEFLDKARSFDCCIFV